MHSQLRKDEKVYCECFNKENYGESGHQERSRLFFPLAVTTVSDRFDNEQDCCRHGCHEKQDYENSKCRVRVIPSTKQVEFAPHKHKKKYLG